MTPETRARARAVVGTIRPEEATGPRNHCSTRSARKGHQWPREPHADSQQPPPEDPTTACLPTTARPHHPPVELSVLWLLTVGDEGADGRGCLPGGGALMALDAVAAAYRLKTDAQAHQDTFDADRAEEERITVRKAPWIPVVSHGAADGTSGLYLDAETGYLGRWSRYNDDHGDELDTLVTYLEEAADMLRSPGPGHTGQTRPDRRGAGVAQRHRPRAGRPVAAPGPGDDTREGLLRPAESWLAVGLILEETATGDTAVSAPAGRCCRSTPSAAPRRGSCGR